MTIDVTCINTLPIFPSPFVLKSIHPAQRAAVQERAIGALRAVLATSDDNLAKTSCVDFLRTHAEGLSEERLNGVVFSQGRAAKKAQERTISTPETTLRKLVLALAIRLAGLIAAGGLTMRIILDLCIVYGLRNPSRVRSLISTAIKSEPKLIATVKHDVIPTFAATLTSESRGLGLHGLRKALECLKRLLTCAPEEVLQEFTRDAHFLVALSRCYDERMPAIATTYGGIDLEEAEDDVGGSDTTLMWIETKVAIIDCFHILLKHLLKGASSSPTQSATASAVLTAIIGADSSPASGSMSSWAAGQTPYLDRPLLVDYQDAYDLKATLTSIFANKKSDLSDALDDFLGRRGSRPSSMLSGRMRAGALKVLLRSNGGATGIDYNGLTKAGPSGTTLGPQRNDATPSNVPSDPLLDSKVSSVLDILPDQDASYIRSLLQLPQYGGETEHVIAALLEGDAPPAASLQQNEPTTQPPPASAVVQDAPSERRYAFNDTPVPASHVSIGKSRDVDGVFEDRAFMQQMKEDILRRAAELSESDEGEGAEDDGEDGEGDIAWRKVSAGNESDTDEDEADDTKGNEVKPQSPETICELAYLQDPKVFDRDAATRRSKARSDLKERTGWGDEQIEGWRVMLERNPKKDKILEKHEFAGNRPGPVPIAGPSGHTHRPFGRGRGGDGRGSRGRGRGGRGRGQSRGGGTGDGGQGHERAWKDKHKASQANHNRKRGHDRKLARGGGLA